MRVVRDPAVEREVLRPRDDDERIELEILHRPHRVAGALEAAPAPPRPETAATHDVATGGDRRDLEHPVRLAQRVGRAIRHAVAGSRAGVERHQDTTDRRGQVVDVGSARRSPGSHPSPAARARSPRAGDRGRATARRRHPSRTPSPAPRRRPGTATRRPTTRASSPSRSIPARERGPQSLAERVEPGVGRRASARASVARPAAAATGLPLNVPPWLTAPGAPRVEDVHHVGPSTERRQRIAAADDLAERRQVGPDAVAAPARRRARPGTR